ncbi:MAG: DUF4342 domain-containing protein [Candidatus Bathyarchaeota archaeon]|jgi:hypothetical protein|nr:DUF4342 domain-containing protein [Candidatus Bathyarchaeota archaeon]
MITLISTKPETHKVFYQHPNFVPEGERSVIYCAKCGAKLKEEDEFCYVCGARASKITREEFSISAENLAEKVKELIHEGNVTRIIVKDEKGKVLLEIPVTVGVIGVVVAPWLAALGVIAALVTNCTIVVERRE